MTNFHLQKVSIKIKF